MLAKQQITELEACGGMLKLLRTSFSGTVQREMFVRCKILCFQGQTKDAKFKTGMNSQTLVLH